MISKRRGVIGLAALAGLAVLLALGARFHPGKFAGRDTNSAPDRPVVGPRIVSLVPSATDILMGMGCGDHLVAVSNFDSDPSVAGLPRVGDYQTTDWERITQLRPSVIVTRYNPRSIPAGFVQRADAIGASRLNLQTETLQGPDPSATIYYAIDQLGQACHEPKKAAEAQARLRSQIRAVRDRVRGGAPVPTLIVIGAEGTMVAGKETFLNELLEIAGGVNVAAGLSPRYPSVDREQILAFHPSVILQLLPDASPQLRAQAARNWLPLKDLPAVRDGRVKQLTAGYVMLPGIHVAETAGAFADALHPGAASQPAHSNE